MNLFQKEMHIYISEFVSNINYSIKIKTQKAGPQK